MGDYPLVDRRGFLKILGVTGAGVALSGCTGGAPEKIIPYVVPPENIIPGVASWFATVCRECPAGCGMLVRNREGRAVKVEGNPQHPVNRGRLCLRGQASLQGLYNPDRLRRPLRRTAGGFQPMSWEEGEKLLAQKLTDLRRRGQADRIALITPLLTGSLDALIEEWMAALGIQRRLVYEPFAYEPLRAANRLTFGRDAIPEYKIEEAQVLLSFGADFLETWLSNVDYARRFAEMHTPRNGRMSRFIHIESRMSLTAANADQWLRVRPGTEGLVVAGMLHVILNQGLAARTLPTDEARQIRAWVQGFDPQTVAARTGVSAEEIERLARAFAAADPGLALGGGVAVTGLNATATQVVINLLNYVTGNVGRTVVFGPDSGLARVSPFADLRALVEAMKQREIEALLFFDVNPVFTLPAALGFAEALSRVPLVVSLSSFPDETTARADLILPGSTSFESWGDYEARRGVRGLQQPVMEPLFETKPVGDILLSLARQRGEAIAAKFPWENLHTYLQGQWRTLQQRVAPEQSFDAFWEEALRRGGVWWPVEAEKVRLFPNAFSLTLSEPRLEATEASELALVVYPSLHHFDGRGANRPWLQEVPDPLTKVVWDNWVEIHPETARRLGLSRGDVVELTSPHGAIELPALPYEGIHPEAVAVALGQGHREYGRYAQGRGANPIELLSPAPEAASGGRAWLSVKVALRRTGRRTPLVSTAGSEQQLDQEIARLIPLAAALRLGEEPETEPFIPELYPEHDHPDYRWGMVIDTHACIGCNACIAACYAENNLALVGKAEVARRRETAWIRIERYFDGRRPQPQSFVPMLCQHCDNAPCEPVCPVYATYHNPEGLNVQVYNRCVGTRYCANNCPYKVRRFNWFDWEWPEPLQLQLNPDVTVRSKGVMEKCTFCVQRIQAAKDNAKDEGRKVRDAEVVPACAQTCPTQAIVFGNLKDPDSRVARLTRTPRRYRVLEELNTRPAITYLKKVIQETV